MADRALRQRVLTIRLAIIAIAVVSVARLFPRPIDVQPAIAELPAATTYSYAMIAPSPLSPARALRIHNGRWLAEPRARATTLAPAAPTVIRYRVETQ
ncbi:MAG: hypothetical protein ACJ79K_08600 [Gemmatimonadaceae bacterium]